MKDEIIREIATKEAERICREDGIEGDASLANERLGITVTLTEALRILDQAGHAVVPKEPTEEMLNAWPRHNHGAGHERAIYHAMLATLQEGRG